MSDKIEIKLLPTIEAWNKLVEEKMELKADVERLQKRDLNASIVLCYDNGYDDPFAREELKHVDVSVSDNIYVVESQVLTDLQAKYDTLQVSHEKLSHVLSVVSAHTEEDFDCKRCRKLIKQALKEAEKL